MVGVFIVKPTRKHRPTTLTVVLCCVGLEHSQLIECNTLIWEVVVCVIFLQLDIRQE